MEIKLKHEGLKNQHLGKDVETLQELMKESRSAVSRNNEEQKKSVTTKSVNNSVEFTLLVSINDSLLY